MLSRQSEKALLDFLSLVMDAEKCIERKRQSLCGIYNFSPQSAFIRMDRDNNDSLSALEVLNFLRDSKQFSITEQDCENFVKFFDQDQDGRLDFEEFLQIIRPCEDTPIRDEALQRPPLQIGRFDYLPANQENIMCDLFTTEILALKKIEDSKDHLRSNSDYSVQAVIQTVDQNNEGGLTVDNLKDFFANHYSYIPKADLFCVIRRMDTDGDAKVSAQEFSEYLKPLTIESNPKIEDAYGQQNQYQAKSWEQKDQYSASKGPSQSNQSFGSPLYGSNSMASPVPQNSSYSNFNPYPSQWGRDTNEMEAPRSHYNREKSYDKRVKFEDSYSTPQKGKHPFEEEKYGYSNLKTAEKSPNPYGQSYGSSFKSSQSPAQSSNEQIIQALKKMMDIESGLEQAKIELCQKEDFNLFDAFKMFDTQSNGWVYINQISQVLDQLQLSFSREELELFFKRYDRNQDGKLQFSEFCESFAPNDPFYFQQLNKRQSNGSKTLSRATIESIKNVWIAHQICVVESERVRQGLKKDPSFNIYDSFSVCDLDGDGVLKDTELQELFESNGLSSNQKGLNCLMAKLDHDKDGIVSYGEFLEEFVKKGSTLLS